MQLRSYYNDGLDLALQPLTGEVFATIGATAKITNKSPSSIGRYVNGAVEGVEPMTLLAHAVETNTGLRSCGLLNENQILQVIIIYKPDLLFKVAESGLRDFLHRLIGYSSNPRDLVQTPKVNPSLAAARDCKEIQSLIGDNPPTLQILLDATIKFHLG